MSNEAELEAKLFKALRSDMTVMLALDGVDEGHSQPMTAQFADDEDRGPIWFFTAVDTDMMKSMGDSHAAMIHFVSKGHDVFATLHGELFKDNDPETIDRLWNRFVAAWYPEGKSDPKLQLIRFEPRRAQIWLNENSLFAGAKILLGRDPKKDYRDKVGEVRLHS